MKYDKQARDRARELRQQENEYEAALWERLRAKRLAGLKFRRQHPLGPYTADFFCATVKLVVEVDGFTHHERREHDRSRDAWMQARGITVLRFRNAELEAGLESVVARIHDLCVTLLVTPLPDPLPASRGEGTKPV